MNHLSLTICACVYTRVYFFKPACVPVGSISIIDQVRAAGWRLRFVYLCVFPRVQREQLAAIFQLLKENQETFGEVSEGDVEEQLRLYSI